MSLSLRPVSSRSWDRAKARHLLNRAGFGVPDSEIDRLASLRPDEAVDFLIDYESQPEVAVEPDWIADPSDRLGERSELRKTARRIKTDDNLSDEERMEMRADLKRSQVQIRREQKQSIERLQQWYFRLMMTTKRPLQEKMTLFWHSHFATSADKVRSPYGNYDLNALFRSAATGNFKLLTYEVGCSPAMMVYLDNVKSRKEHPNENWARELMELYTLGQGRYTEEDIHAAARAFTGWSTDGEAFVYRASLHDDGEKEFMGHKGRLNGNDIFDIIFSRPEAAEFISTKLWEYFAFENPDENLKRELTQALYTDAYELKPFLRKVFLSEAFYSEESMGSRIKSPAELAIGMLHTLDLEEDPLVDKYVTFSMGRMGQDLFHAPNVKGWPGGRLWISAGTLMSRYNLSGFLVEGLVTDFDGGLRRDFVERYRQDPRFRKSVREARARAQRMKTSASEGMDMADGRDSESSGGPEGLKLPDAPFDVLNFFSPYQGMEVSQVARSLAGRQYSVPLRDDQLRQIEAGLDKAAGADFRLRVEGPTQEDLRELMHLMMSAAEYQLC